MKTSVKWSFGSIGSRGLRATVWNLACRSSPP